MARYFDMQTRSLFLLEIDGLVVAEFSEVTGLESESEVVEYEEGGENIYTHKFRGPNKHQNLTLKHGVSKLSPAVWAWREAVIHAKTPPLLTVSIIMLDDHGEEFARWAFRNAFPYLWEGPTFKAGASEIAIETLGLTHDGYRVESQHRPPPPEQPQPKPQPKPDPPKPDPVPPKPDPPKPVPDPVPPKPDPVPDPDPDPPKPDPVPDPDPPEEEEEEEEDDCPNWSPTFKFNRDKDDRYWGRYFFELPNAGPGGEPIVGIHWDFGAWNRSIKDAVKAKKKPMTSFPDKHDTAKPARHADPYHAGLKKGEFPVAVLIRLQGYPKCAWVIATKAPIKAGVTKKGTSKAGVKWHYDGPNENWYKQYWSK